MYTTGKLFFLIEHVPYLVFLEKNMIPIRKVNFLLKKISIEIVSKNLLRHQLSGRQIRI